MVFIRREHHSSKLILKDDETQCEKTPDHYRNGKLFGDSDD